MNCLKKKLFFTSSKNLDLNSKNVQFTLYLQIGFLSRKQIKELIATKKKSFLNHQTRLKRYWYFVTFNEPYD